jgi:hypothetical protein
MNKRKNYCWTFGNPWSVRFLDDPPADPPGDPPADPPADPPEGIVSIDGTLAKDWALKLKDESLHADKTLATIKNVEMLAKSYVHVRKQVPMDKVAIPTEHSTETDWEAFHIAGGRPETAGDYGEITKRPEDIAEEHWDEKFMEGLNEVHLKAGLSKKQVQMLRDYDNAALRLKITNMNNDAEFAQTTLLDNLHAEWGNAYEQKVHFGTQAIDKASMNKDGVIDEEFKQQLVDEVHKRRDGKVNPILIKAFANLGAKVFAEHGLVETSLVDTPAEIIDRINKAMQHPAYLDRTHPEHKLQQEKVNRLYEEQAKSKPKKVAG